MVVDPNRTGWDKIMAHVVAEEQRLAFACIDGTVARAHQKAAGARPNKPTPLSLSFNRENYPDKQAFGRSRGGFSGKIVGVCNAAGRLVDFAV